MALTARATRGGSSTGAGLVVAPRPLAAFAMRLAAETRDERVRAAGVVVEAALRRFPVGGGAGAVAGMAPPSEVGVGTEVGAVRRGARGDGLPPVDFGVAFTTVELARAGLALDWAALGLVTLGLVALLGLAALLAGAFAAASSAEEEAFTVRAGFAAADFALAVRFTAVVGPAVAGEDPRASELVAVLARVERPLETLTAPAERLPAALAALALELASASVSIGATRLALAPRLTDAPRVLPADLRDEGAGAIARVRWESTRAHSSSLRLAGLAPWAWATRAAFSMSATRLLQEVAKRMSDWDLAPLSTRVSITPAADTFLRRRLKISFWSWAIRASALSLSVIVS